MTIAGYNIRKAAQVAAFFALQEGGTINVLKLTKLIYLADRKSLEKYDAPILFDKLVSMPHGPVNSLTYSFIDGCCESKEWDAFITDRAQHDVSVSRKNMTVDDLDQLSDAEIVVLTDTWKEFGAMSKYAIRDYTHQYCPEWVNPDGSSNPIEYEIVLKFLGKTNSAALAHAIEEERTLSTAWS